MKVILLQDVAKIGRRFDIVNVADGYGLNKLIPRGLAEMATPENLRKVKIQAEQTAALRDAADASFASVVKSLEGKVVDVLVEANEDGKMYQALKLDDVVAAVKKAEDVDLLPASVVIKTPIKQLGEHQIQLVSGAQEAVLTINVISA